ncbi:uncharacterized protein LOC128820673 isoform X5 [Vidua macroura]|uniref:uncharacterized protein LOC128820673 isoform X5 n=1 Tax=Vidua macroura TaxID=187451 RepID=UPI0023A8857D|nr:uncharacterized protein LOC128820673 isoform X5 [Vidua macroura]
MALALRLFLPLLLAVALPARAAQAAPLQARGAAWDGDMAYPDAVLDDSLNLLENAGGPSPWKNSDSRDKKSLEAARHLDQMLSDLERRREMNRKAVLKAAFPGGSSGPLAAPAAGSEAMPGTVTGAWDGDMAYPDAVLDDSLNLLENAGGPPPWKNADTGDKKSLEAARHLDQMLSDLERRRGGCISLSLPLGLSSRGLSLHIWTRRAQHRGKGSMAAWLPRCCFPALQGCFPAWPGCSFSPASAGRHLASAGREPKLHHGPEIPAISRSLGRSGMAPVWGKECPGQSQNFL